MPPSNKPERARDPASQRRTCRKQALDLLARREHGRRELERKLLACSHDPGMIVEVLDALEAEGLLEDARFVESFLRARVGRGQGPLRIRADLAQRGIDEARIREGLRDAGEDWSGLAADVRRKRFGAEAPTDFKERARQARFLAYRGFEREQIDAALDLAADSD